MVWGTGSPSGVQGPGPGRGSPEAKAFGLNKYKFLGVHGRKFNELDSIVIMH